MSVQFNWIEISTRMLRTSEEHSIYTKFGHNYLIETIDGYDGTVHRGPFRLSRGRSIPMNGLDDPAQLIVIKRLGCRPLDRDRTAEMRSALKHLGCYNAFKTPCAF